METNSIYQHHPVIGGENIRVLKLHPARNLDDPIHCSLEVLSLDGIESKNSPYDALSYVWGSPPVRNQEIICDKFTLLVTENCRTALQYLRLPSKIRVLWVDAICIDQSTVLERNHQVQLMGAVYKRARKVLIWIGSGNQEIWKLVSRARFIGRYKLWEVNHDRVERSRKVIWTGELYAALPNSSETKQGRLYTDIYLQTKEVHKL
jgi:hypothetical protein